MKDAAHRFRGLVSLAGVVLALAAATPNAQVTQDAPARRPDAIVDLMTDEGVRLVRGTWRYSDARIVSVAHRPPGPDLRASGPPNQTHDIEPKAAALKREIPSFVTTPKDHPLRKEFSRLHGISAACNLVVFGGGVALVVLF